MRLHRVLFLFFVLVPFSAAATKLTVKEGCARINRTPLCDPDWWTWFFNWATNRIQTSDSAEIDPKGVVVVAGFRPYSIEPNENPRCWQTMKIPGNPPPSQVFLSVQAGDYCLYKSWGFGGKRDKILDSKGIGVCCREMEENKSLPNPYLWIQGGPHADAGSNTLYASKSAPQFEGSETVDSSAGIKPNFAALQKITTDSDLGPDSSNFILPKGDTGIDPAKSLTAGTGNNLDTNAGGDDSFDVDVNTKRKRVLRYVFRA